MPKRLAPCVAIFESLAARCSKLPTLCALLMFWAAPARAQTVLLLRPPKPSPTTMEVVARLHGELLAVGFEVVTSEPVTQPQADAVVEVLDESVPLVVDVEIAEPASPPHSVARVALEPNTENAARKLAIRVSEVLRAHFQKTPPAPSPPSSAATQPRALAAVPVQPALEAESQPRLGFELGAAVLASLSGVGPAILPLGRVDWTVSSNLELEATFAGFGTRPTVASDAGSASIASTYGLLGASYLLRSARSSSPFIALSLGALQTTVEGRAELPRQGHNERRASFLCDASLGVAFELTRHYRVRLAAHAQLAQPYVAIHLMDRTVASSGWPNLSMSLTLGAWP